MRRPRVTSVTLESFKHYIFSVRVSSLIIQHAQRTRSITLPSVASLDVPYFPTLSRKRHSFEKVIENKMCLLFFSTTSV